MTTLSVRETKQWGALHQGLKVPPAAHVITYALYHGIEHPATEMEMVDECLNMRLRRMHDFDLGCSSNLRNRIQRNWARSTIFQTKWQRENYAPIFVRVDGRPVRWWLVKGFVP